MPKWLHKKVAKSGREQGLIGDRLKAYIYSTLQKYKEAHGGKEKKSRRKGKLAKP